MCKQLVAALGVVAVLAEATTVHTQTAANQTPSAPATPTEPSSYERVWSSFTDLYDDQSNPFIQRILFTGRFHHDFAVVEASEGEHKESNVRRLRLGPRITLFRRWLFHAEVELNPQERDPLYARFTDLYVQWNRGSRLAITIGKQSIPFTQEGATSSRELLTIDRSNLANNVWFSQEYMPGVSVSGQSAPWVYRGGVYSAGAANRELGEFSGGLFTLAVLGYDFAKKLEVREALLTGNYVYQPPDADNTFTRPLEHIGSINFRLQHAQWGLRGDVSMASGADGQSDIVAVMLMPFVNLTGQLQLVTRYTVVDSERANGVQLATYENRVIRGRGDRYNEGYIGANYYFYGHRLKLQSALQYAEMRDRAADSGSYSGWGWTTGIRVGW